MKLFATLFTATLFAFWIPQWHHHPKPYAMPDEAGAVDGPYVLYRNDSVLVEYIDSIAGQTKSVRTQSFPMVQKNKVDLVVNTDETGKTFHVKLKGKLENEKATYGKPKSMLVISDIEGNFTAFRKLLQGNRVIDNNLHWTYGKGHLVLNGDFVDRGNMVTQVLWLIYSLEQQAEAVGGKVHFVLGNHEVMNMGGEHDYVAEEVMANTKLLNVDTINIYGPNTELGRWMATKNVAERVGNMLFIHGGISRYVNMMQLTLKEMNELVRPHYTDTAYNFTDPRVEILYSDFGPLWYRGYYMDTPRARQPQIDSTLDLYDARYIATGHSIVANQICSFFGGKVFNTDLQHAKGKSEALLMEDGKLFRTNANGERKPIEAFPQQ